MTSGHVATRYKVRFRAGHSWLHVKLRSISHLTSVGLWPGCRETNKKGGERWDWAGWSFNRASYNRRRPWSGQFGEERESKSLLERKEEQRGLNEERVKKYCDDVVRHVCKTRTKTGLEERKKKKRYDGKEVKVWKRWEHMWLKKANEWKRNGDSMTCWETTKEGGSEYVCEYVGRIILSWRV